jgi:hypothetical protein
MMKIKKDWKIREIFITYSKFCNPFVYLVHCHYTFQKEGYVQTAYTKQTQNLQATEIYKLYDMTCHMT